MSKRKWASAVLLLFGILLPIAGAQASERIYYFHNDHLGTPQSMTDAAGRVVWKAEYDPFGKATVNQDPDGDGQVVVNNLRFPGQYFDAESGLHYNYHRDYDPGTGRYLQPDPIGLAGGLNLYNYADGNPLSNTDASGLNPAAGVIAACMENPACAGAAIAAGAAAASAMSSVRQAAYDAYKKIEDDIKNLRNGGDECAYLKAKLAMVRKLRAMVQGFDALYAPGRHDTKLESIDGWIRNLEKEIRAKCGDCNP